MTIPEAKTILLLYRPGTTDADEPQLAEALALARQEAELGAWLEAHCSRQMALREKFRQIPIPAGLKEQIISEQAAQQRASDWKRRKVMIAAAVCLMILAGLLDWYSRPAPENTLTIYQHEMIGLALRGYGMDLVTNDLSQIRTYLAQHQAPANFQLSAALKNTTVNGCAVESWQDAKVTMVCFHTPKSADQNNLWLFVVDESAVRKVNVGTSPSVGRIHRLVTATWVQDGKLYLLGTEGDEQDIRSYL